MAVVLQPWQVLVAVFAGWISRQQGAVIDNSSPVEVWGIRGLVTFYVFFVIELSTRKIEIAGLTPSPNQGWMLQIGRHLTDPVDGILTEKKFLILDRAQRAESPRA